MLVLNKLDRLFVELQMEPGDVYQTLAKIIEQCNALATSLGIAKDDEQAFDPTVGNVVFCSAAEGYGFRICDFAQLYAPRLGMDVKLLTESLWGETYLTKTKEVVHTPPSTSAEPMVVTLVLSIIKQLYDKMVPLEDDPERTDLKTMLARLKIDVPQRELMNRSLPVVREGVLGRFLPLAKTTLQMVVDHVPSPVKRITEVEASDDHHDEHKVVAYVSKMLETETSFSARVKYDPYIGFLRVLTGTINLGTNFHVYSVHDVESVLKYIEQQETSPEAESASSPAVLPQVPSITVQDLYELKGRDLINISRVNAGHICGMGGLMKHVVKAAILCTEPLHTLLVSDASLRKYVANLMTYTLNALQAAIITITVDPEVPAQLPELMEGLQMLNRVDAAVKVAMSDRGESLLSTAGEVHLERCLKDLREKIVPGVPFLVSEPIIPLRETLSEKCPSTTTSVDVLGRFEYTLSVAPLASMEKRTDVTRVASRGENVLFTKSQLDHDLLRDLCVSAFHLFVKSGPLCEEPVSHVAVTIESVRQLADNVTSNVEFGSALGNLSEAMRECFRKCADHRLEEPCYMCTLYVAENTLGKAHAVLARRRARVVSEDIQEGTSLFVVSSLLPVAESFGFAEEMRKRTSGNAAPQLKFDSWQMMDSDPLKAEELDEEGEKLDKVNLARRFMEKCRRRKGLFVEEKIVERADKQRTLTKNK
jgi:translation elongation factor EF-G